MFIAGRAMDGRGGGDSGKRSATIPGFVPFDHMAGGFAQGEEHAMDVDRFQLLKILKADVEHIPARLADPRIGDGLVNPTKF